VSGLWRIGGEVRVIFQFLKDLVTLISPREPGGFL